MSASLLELFDQTFVNLVSWICIHYQRIGNAGIDTWFGNDLRDLFERPEARRSIHCAETFTEFLRTTPRPDRVIRSPDSSSTGLDDGRSNGPGPKIQEETLWLTNFHLFPTTTLRLNPTSTPKP
ncbi:MAG TPA: hypothetical protein VGM27_04790 [Acidobacteriaceae bacterium]